MPGQASNELQQVTKTLFKADPPPYKHLEPGTNEPHECQPPNSLPEANALNPLINCDTVIIPYEVIARTTNNTDTHTTAIILPLVRMSSVKQFFTLESMYGFLDRLKALLERQKEQLREIVSEQEGYERVQDVLGVVCVFTLLGLEGQVLQGCARTL
jgi:hypothetical protein